MTVQDEIRQRIEKDVLLARLRRKSDSGKADFNDTFLYSDRAGKLLGEIFSRRLPDIPLEEREALCVELLRDRYTDINQLIDRVQRALDEAQNLHIAPQHAPFRNERAHKIGNATADPTVPVETQQRRAESALATMTRAMHDDRMKKEADFRSRAGLQCYITRKTDGKCCEWCDKMAGRYEYHSEPKDIYRRHDNCGCSVTYENGRQRQDVWSKRTWEAPEPGAGAGDPVVFTKEQTKKLQAEKQLSYLTSGVKHGKLNAEEQQFLDRILSDPDMTPEYRQILMDRFSSGSSIAQKAFAKFVPDNSVSDSDYTRDSAFYWRVTKSISMSYDRDQNQWALNGSTWFHEHGHLIDDFAGQITFNHPEYLDAIRSDFAKLISSRTKSKQPLSYVDAIGLLAKDPNLQKILGAELDFSPAQQTAVSDIMEGISGAMVRGCSGHIDDDPNYWSSGYVISSEAFAHMFEAQFDEARYKQMQMYFPNALEMFENILKEVVI
ncbi:MAG: hypothetical protein K5705_06155 [Oscillospiraceae bacterium]|nr:hypothetical protein [Oscillospiraceae bacterium]